MGILRTFLEAFSGDTEVETLDLELDSKTLAAVEKIRLAQKSSKEEKASQEGLVKKVKTGKVNTKNGTSKKKEENSIEI